MKRLLTLTATFALALTSSMASEGTSVAVTGRVFDAAGEQLTEYEISTHFSWIEGELIADEGFTLDDEGLFAGTLEFAEADGVLIVYSADRTEGAVVKLSQVKASDLKINLQKTTRVWGSVTCDELGERPAWFNVNWNLEEISPISCDSTTGKFDLRLPLGFWNYDLYDSWFTTLTGELPLDGRLRVVDMGKLDLPASYIALNEGRVIADWSPTAARNIALEKASLKALRGKWVYVEFWGHQWETSTQESLPALMKFYVNNRSDEFEVIAFHDNTVSGFVELDKKLAPVKRKHWKGHQLPFPILLDETGDTLRRFQINAFPTNILIDPDGRLIGNADLAMLKRALAGKLKAPTPR